MGGWAKVMVILFWSWSQSMLLALGGLGMVNPKWDISVGDNINRAQHCNGSELCVDFHYYCNVSIHALPSQVWDIFFFFQRMGAVMTGFVYLLLWKHGAGVEGALVLEENCCRQERRCNRWVICNLLKDQPYHGFKKKKKENNNSCCWWNSFASNQNNPKLQPWDMLWKKIS